MRVNFIKDIGMLKRFEDRKKQIDDKKALENEAAKNNCLFKTSKPQATTKVNSLDLKDIFLKKAVSYDQPPQQQQQSVAKILQNKQKVAATGATQKFTAFKPTNSLIVKENSQSIKEDSKKVVEEGKQAEQQGNITAQADGKLMEIERNVVKERQELLNEGDLKQEYAKNKGKQQEQKYQGQAVKSTKQRYSERENKLERESTQKGDQKDQVDQENGISMHIEKKNAGRDKNKEEKNAEQPAKTKRNIVKTMSQSRRLKESEMDKEDNGGKIAKVEGKNKKISERDISGNVSSIPRENKQTTRVKKERENQASEIELIFQENDQNQIETKQDNNITDKQEDVEASQVDAKKAAAPTRKKSNKTTILKKSKGENFVRQDLKRKWKDRFLGGVNTLKMKFTKNGKLKENYRKKFEQEDKPSAFANIQTESDRHNGTKSQLYSRSQKQNMFMNCLSEGLIMTIDGNNNADTTNITDDAAESTVKREPLSEIDLQDHSDENLHRILKSVFGFDSFRSGQLEGIRSIIEGHSTLIVQSTGHGKSLIYQFPSILREGMAIVISPLIALMMDQVKKLPREIPGVAYNSSLTWDEKKKVIQMIKENRVKLLYISPEVLQSDFFNFFRVIPKISYVCIDEAHCVSEWSHNFRTSYLIINDLIQQKLKCEQIVALTATATLQTQVCIGKKLGIKNSIRGASVERSNLKISVSRDQDKNSAVFKLLKSLPLTKKDSIIIYARYKWQCESLAQFLTYSGIVSAAYHSGCEDKRKAQIYEDFMSGEIQIVVATIAFGMGIDKADIRAVIHMNMPKTIENYVQEAGRAGRDGKTAYCHMFLSDEDFYRECGYVRSDQLDFPQLVQFFGKMKQAIHSIQDEGRGVFKKRCNKKKEKDQAVDYCERPLEDAIITAAMDKFCYMDLKELTMELDSKKETLQTLLMKMGQQQDQDHPFWRVYPVGNRNCSIKFYRTNAEEVSQKVQFVKDLVEGSKQTHGCYTFNVCDMCNKFGIDPLELQRKLKELSKEGINMEYKEETLTFQLIQSFSEAQVIQILDQVYEDLCKYADTQLHKIEFIYAVSKMSSYPSVDYMLEHKLFSEETKTASMGKYFDPYFNFEGSTYTQILQDADINLKQVLPYEQLLSEDREKIMSDVSSFMRTEILEKDVDNQAERLSQFRNPKVITRIFQGISSYRYEIKEWKSTTFWDRYYQFKYEELYEVVQEGISDFIFENESLPKRKIKKTIAIPQNNDSDEEEEEKRDNEGAAAEEVEIYFDN